MRASTGPGSRGLDLLVHEFEFALVSTCRDRRVNRGGIQKPEALQFHTLNPQTIRTSKTLVIR